MYMYIYIYIYQKPTVQPTKKAAASLSLFDDSDEGDLFATVPSSKDTKVKSITKVGSLFLREVAFVPGLFVVRSVICTGFMSATNFLVIIIYYYLGNVLSNFGQNNEVRKKLLP